MEMRRRLPGGEFADRFTLADEESKLVNTIELPDHPRVKGVAAWQKLFGEVDDFEDLWDHRTSWEEPHYLDDNFESLAALWNLTPRAQLRGRRPAELFLRDMLVAPFDEEELPPSTSRCVLCTRLLDLMEPERFTPEFLAFVEAGRPRGAGAAQRRALGSIQRAKPPTRWSGGRGSTWG